MLLPRPSSQKVECSGVQIVEFQKLPSLFQCGVRVEKSCPVHLKGANELGVARKIKCVCPAPNWGGGMGEEVPISWMPLFMLIATAVILSLYLRPVFTAL